MDDSRPDPDYTRNTCATSLRASVGFSFPPRTLRSSWVYILGPTTGSFGSCQERSSLEGTAQSSPLPQSSSRVYSLRLSPGMSAAETCPVSATTPGFHSGPPSGTMIQKVITVIKPATWEKIRDSLPFAKPSETSGHTQRNLFSHGNQKKCGFFPL